MIIGVDIGGTKIRVASSFKGDKINRSIDVATPQNQRKVISTIEEIIDQLASSDPIDAITVACPGPIDKKRGMILTPTNIDWRNLNLVSPLAKAYKCPVMIENDATCGAIAESRLGAARKQRLVLYVTISTGIGTAIVLDKKPLPSPYNQEGGQHIIDLNYHHTHGQSGSFERIVSGSAIKHRFGKIAANIKDKTSWEIIAHDIAIGLNNLIVIIQPEIIVMGGGVNVHFAKFRRPLMKYLKDLKPLYPHPPIVQANFVETAPLLGAILLATDNA